MYQNTAVAYKMKFNPIVLKKLVSDCDISQSALAGKTGLSRASINLMVNRGYMPSTKAGLKKQVEQLLTANETAMAWLVERRLSVTNIWDTLGEDIRRAQPAGMARRGWDKRATRAMVPGDPGEYKQEVETEMLRGETLKHFRLFRSPFSNDIRDVQDIYMSEEHRYIAAAMVDAAKHGGALVVIGEVGSGKSVIRKKIVSELSLDDSSRIIYPRMIDKTRITGASICDAIIMDLSDESPKMKLEQKTRQVERLLLSRSKAGCHVCIMIEEAHDLTVRVLKLLKRFYEIEDGYKKALGIILIGQPELGALFNEQDHYDMREVIRRFQVAHIRGLNGNMKEYLTLKFKRVSVDLKTIIDDAAIAALTNRLTDKDERGKRVSNAYPLTVNNMIIKAMNLACDMGEARVTEEVVNAI
jgi:type II secretory pathway predicted ATPase ExeA